MKKLELLIVFATVFVSRQVFPCNFIPPEEHVVCPSESLRDHSAPVAPGDVAFELEAADQSMGTCGEYGILTIEFRASTDDLSQPDEIGYRLEVLEGMAPPFIIPELPETVRARIGSGGVGTVRLRWYDTGDLELESIRFVLSIAAVDKAGNESEAVTIEVYDKGGEAEGGCTALRKGHQTSYWILFSVAILILGLVGRVRTHAFQ